jgi:hypothetical protein
MTDTNGGLDVSADIYGKRWGFLGAPNRILKFDDL